MVAFDASSMIHAWDNYPLENFPPLWEWIATEIASENIVLPQIAFEQIEKKAPDCGKWLKDNSVHRIKESNDILTEASRIKGLLGIIDEGYSSKGVDEPDIFIIATSKVHDIQLISNERRQFILPQVIANYKIPAVCSLPSVAISCLDFIQFIRNTGTVFG
ncbi:MAG: DUF4411 family protein [Planctomycetia bacterium]|nr:DUF4411 family protein [Planctomycetia bacterium]